MKRNGTTNGKMLKILLAAALIVMFVSGYLVMVDERQELLAERPGETVQMKEECTEQPDKPVNYFWLNLRYEMLSRYEIMSGIAGERLLDFLLGEEKMNELAQPFIEAGYEKSNGRWYKIR